MTEPRETPLDLVDEKTLPGSSPAPWIGVETALSGRPSLRTVRADFPHTALQSSGFPVGVEIADMGVFQ